MKIAVDLLQLVKHENTIKLSLNSEKIPLRGDDTLFWVQITTMLTMLSVKRKITIFKLPNILYYVRIAEAVRWR